jgi:hypothetical protein
MTNLRTALALSVLLLAAAAACQSAGGLATPEAKNNDYSCGGSVLRGIANSGSRFTAKVSPVVSTDLYGQFHRERPAGAANIVLTCGQEDGP